LKYQLNFIGVYGEATPRELMIPNIQQMIYIKMENTDATPKSLEIDLLAQFPDDEDKQMAVTDWIVLQLANENVDVTMDTVLEPADGTHFIQFDLRPEGTF
jgi:hypothetical protein